MLKFVRFMKQGIHPAWYEEAKVTCACGTTFTVGSTQPEIHVEVCYACHPFYTGETKYIDTLGRVEKFQQRQAASKPQNQKAEASKNIEEETPRKTLKEILAELKTQGK